MERVKGFEPSTSTLARLRSTPELRPHVYDNSKLEFFFNSYFHIFYKIRSLPYHDHIIKRLQISVGM